MPTLNKQRCYNLRGSGSSFHGKTARASTAPLRRYCRWPAFASRYCRWHSSVRSPISRSATLGDQQMPDAVSVQHGSVLSFRPPSPSYRVLDAGYPEGRDRRAADVSGRYQGRRLFCESTRSSRKPGEELRQRLLMGIDHRRPRAATMASRTRSSSPAAVAAITELAPAQSRDRRPTKMTARRFNKGVDGFLRPFSRRR